MRKLKVAVAFLILCGSVFAVHKQILTSAAQYLVSTDEPSSADVIVVLGGDASGARAIKGCQLLQKGFSNQMWLSGSSSFYGRTEGSLAIDFLRERGCPVEKMEPLKNTVDSTRDEAVEIGRMMRERGVKRYLLVTSNFHTRRSGKVFRSASPDLKAVVVAADDNDFPVNHWWELRHARKTFFYEWLKTVAYWVEL